MHFRIRDLLWLTVVVALGVAWWVDRSRLIAAHERMESIAITLRDHLDAVDSGSWSLRLPDGTVWPEELGKDWPDYHSAPAPITPKK